MTFLREGEGSIDEGDQDDGQCQMPAAYR